MPAVLLLLAVVAVTVLVVLGFKNPPAPPEPSRAPSVGVTPYSSKEAAAALMRDYELEAVACVEQCPLAMGDKTRRLSPSSPVFVGYHDGVELRLRVAFAAGDYSDPRIAVIPPADGRTAHDLVRER